jgi:hypothetical protein
VAARNGERLDCFWRFSSVLICMQGVGFVFDFYLQAIDRFDAVLGIQWLWTLGPVQWDL